MRAYERLMSDKDTGELSFKVLHFSSEEYLMFFVLLLL